MSRASVLIVDDVEANLVALDAVLASLTCEVVRARSGNGALVELLKRDFAVMLLDVQMPDMDGFEVAKIARGHPTTCNVPIIFVTAMLETEHGALQGYGSGAVDFLFKPINAGILRGKVQVFLELYEQKHQLAEAVRAHQRAVTELDAFNYSVSHDLRAPLRPIAGFAQVLLEDCAKILPVEAVGQLERILSAARRMEQLIDDLLNLSQVTRADLVRCPVNLSALAGDVVTELRRDHPNRTVDVVVQPDLRAQGDARLVRIVLENLIRNAWKFTQKKERSRIEFGERSDRPGVFFVADNGAGFNARYASKLFRPFQRLHSAADFQGTGIGLAIVQRVVHRHGGEVWAEGVSGQGASFFFSLSEPGHSESPRSETSDAAPTLEPTSDGGWSPP